MADAARVDGASGSLSYESVLPLSMPVLAAVTVFTFLCAWNDFQDAAIPDQPAEFHHAWAQDFKKSAPSPRLVNGSLRGFHRPNHRRQRAKTFIPALN
jgi:hypothetical protein